MRIRVETERIEVEGMKEPFTIMHKLTPAPSERGAPPALTSPSTGLPSPAAHRTPASCPLPPLRSLTSPWCEESLWERRVSSTLTVPSLSSNSGTSTAACLPATCMQ